MIPAPVLRLAGRVGVVCVALVIVSMIGVQYARVIERNVALAHELHDVDGDIAVLRQRAEHQKREIRRLSDPQGAVPEIHDRLHLLRDREAIIYLERGEHPRR